MKVWQEIKQGPDGNEYAVRYLMTDEEAKSLQRTGLVGSLWRVEYMQEVADRLIADLHKQAHIACGGSLQ